MFVNGTTGWVLGKPIVARLLRALASFLFGIAVLSWIVAHVGPRYGVVQIHVAEPDVIVTVDDQTFTIEDQRYTPITCTLREGRHSLQMRRGDEILYAEEFHIRGGQELILTAWNPAGRLETSRLQMLPDPFQNSHFH